MPNESGDKGGSRTGKEAFTASEQPMWPAGDDEMASRIRAFDWLATPLGPIAGWPQGLKTVVDLMLNSVLPSYVWWGPDLIQLHNNAAIEVSGAKHCELLGTPARKVWTEAWKGILDLAEIVYTTGRPKLYVDVPVASDPSSPSQTTWFTFSYSALRDEAGSVSGIFIIATDTTVRVCAETALGDTETHYRSLFNSIDQGYMEVELFMSGEGRVVDWRYMVLNPAFERLTGLSDITGMLVSEVMPDLEPEWAERYTQVVNTGEAMRFELPASGVGRWFDAYLTRIGDVGSRRVAVVYNDITDRKQADTALREREAQQAFLLKFSDALRAEPSPDAIANRALRMLFEHMQLDRCYIGIYRLAEDTGAFPHQVHDNRLPPLPAQVRLSEFPKAVQVASDQTLVINDITKMEGLSDNERASFAGLGMGALIVASLRKGENNPLWAMCAVSASARVWTPGEVSVVEEGAERTWAAIERARAEERLQAAHDTFRSLIDRSPFGTYVINADFCLVQISEGGQKPFANVRPLIGRDFAEVVQTIWPDPFATEVIAHFRHTLATGEPYYAEINERRADINATEGYDWKIERIIMPDGRFGVVCHFYDLSERIHHEEHVRLLMAEVNHRSKNMLSLVQAIAKRTVATHPKDFIERFGERVQALAASQDLLVKSEWKAVSLGELVHAQLAHFDDAYDSRITLDGPQLAIKVSASQALGMALHELATNAAKYGALSNTSGRVIISWSLPTDAAGKARFTMSWIESGGPPVAKPTRLGFGSTVTGSMIKMSLGGDVAVDYAPTGLIWRIDCLAVGLLEGSAPPAPRSNGDPVMDKPRQATGRCRVLVVEDEPLLAMDIDLTLTEAGYDVIGPANTVAQALMLIAQSGCDIAVLDTNLNTETAELVAHELVRRGTPFISMSGYAREQQPEIMRTGPLLSKPLKRGELVAEIAQCLGR